MFKYITDRRICLRFLLLLMSDSQNMCTIEIVLSKDIIAIPFNKHGIRATSQLGLGRNTSQNGKR